MKDDRKKWTTLWQAGGEKRPLHSNSTEEPEEAPHIDVRIAQNPLLRKLLLECIEEIARQTVARKIHPADPETANAWLKQVIDKSWLVKIAGEEQAVEALGALYTVTELDTDYRHTHPWM